MTTGTTTVAARPWAIPPLVEAMRPYQWPKNVIVFAGFVFSAGSAWDATEPSSWWPLLWRTIALFAIWCAVSSAMYLINDIRDREADRLHPRKRYRAIARGAVSIRLARTTAAVLLVTGLPLAVALDQLAGIIVAGYAAIMILYSWGLKDIVILDVIILCTGVVARAVGGAAAIDVEISPWLYVCTSFGAFFFASSKRWAEFRQLGADAAAHRPALAAYNSEILNQLLIISASTALLAYSIYTIESANVPGDGSMALTIPFVAFGLFRYLLLLSGERRADAPDRILFTDPQLLLSILGFGLVALAVLLAH